MPGAFDVRHSSVSTTGFADGLGRRSIGFDRELGAALECLHVRPELSAYEPALRAQAAAVAALDDERLVRVRSIERDGTRLLVTSELVIGDRLLDVIDARGAGDAAVSGLDAAFGFLLQILPALSRLHAAGLVHGAVSPGSVTLTSTGQVVLGDAIYGAVLPRLHLSRRRLWSEFQIAAPRSAVIVRFDATADVTQASMIALLLALGRPLDADDPIDALPTLVTEAVEVAQIRGGDQLAETVRAFFTGTLPLDGMRTGVTADQAAKEAVAIASGALGDDACLAALAEFVRYDAPAAPVPAPRPAAILKFEAPTPVAVTAAPVPEPFVEIELDVDETDIEDEPVVELEIAREPEIAAEPPVAEPAATYAGQDPWTWSPEPARALTPDVEPIPEPVVASSPQVVPELLVPAPVAVVPEPLAPAPIAVVPEPLTPAPVVAEPEATPLIERPEAEFIYEPPPPPLVPLTPKAAPAPFVPTPFVPAPAPLVPPVMQPAAAAYAPSPDYRPAPMAAPPAQGLGGSRAIGFSPNPNVIAPPAAPRFAPPPVTPPAPVAQPTLRLKQEAPVGFAPQRAAHVAPAMDYSAPVAARRDEPVGFPKKLAAALVIITIGAIIGGKLYMQQESAQAEGPKPVPAKVTSKAPVANPSTPVATGVLAITSIPSGAKVLLNGTAAGETPLRLDGLPPGRHTITLSTESTTVKRTVRVEAGKELTLDIPVFSGWVAIFAPIVLDVAEGSRGLGSTENGRILLPPGRHVLTVSNRQLGYSATHTVEIGAGEEARLNLTPTGMVSINAQPWAEVWIDGTKAGETPLANLEVPLGTREFVFRHPQYGERKITATVTASPATTLSVDFTKTQGH